MTSLKIITLVVYTYVRCGDLRLAANLEIWMLDLHYTTFALRSKLLDAKPPHGVSPLCDEDDDQDDRQKARI